MGARSARAAGAVLGLLLGFLADCPSGWTFGFSVEPARVQVSVPAGKRRGQTLTVKNAQSEPTHLTVYVRDVIYLPDGTHEFPPAGSTEWSCATWIQVVPQELNIPPDGSRDVRVSITAPAEVQGGRYAVIFFETGPSYAEEGIGVNFRVGAIVEALIQGTERYDAKLKDVSFVEPAEFRTELFNDGNLLIRPTGRVKVFEALGKKVRDLELNPTLLGVLPKTLRAFSTTLENPLPAGSYRVKVEVDYGARTLIVGERPFEAR